MKSLKGLVLKDLYVIRHNSGLLAYCLIFGMVFTLLYLVGNNNAGTVPGDSSFIQHGLMQTLCMTMVISTFAYDKQAHWDPYMLTMPVSRGEAVWSKYIASGIFVLAATAYSLVIDLLIVALKLRPSIPWIELIISLGVALMTCSIMLPMVIHMGAEKFRLMLIVVSIFQFAALSFLSTLALSSPSLGFQAAVVLGTLLASLVAMVISRFIAKNIFCKKEF